MPPVPPVTRQTAPAGHARAAATPAAKAPAEGAAQRPEGGVGKAQARGKAPMAWAQTQEDCAVSEGRRSAAAATARR
ncbi:hypothetical protein AB1Y20_023635 [Prymnesium parvum]|uniref:Uncharacterized protein n=1 Tax=Prymnesium parvum TaxID=97485 RepID=A0AB34JGX9_PRYPA